MLSGQYIERVPRHTDSNIDLHTVLRKSWPGVTAEFVRYSYCEPYDFCFTSSAHYLALLNIQRSHGETQVTDLPRSTRKDLRNRLTFVPASCELSGWSELARPASVTAVYFNPVGLDAMETAAPDLSSVSPMTSFADPMLRAALLQFQSVLSDPDLDTPGYAETLGALVSFELSRCGRQHVTLQQGGLTTRQARQVMEYVEEHLPHQTSVGDLAGLVNLSRFHFIRAFKKTVGMPPHQYLLHRRVEHAKELLAAGKLSVTEIAEQSGFNSTTQLTRSFRRIVGLTPTTYRRDLS